jgi:very-short-patch-repair endonuclease/phosphoribosylcarboxyaminoimidazole (NCAIR) mutase
MGTRSTTVEEICAQLASRSHGIVTRAELLAAGVTARQITRRRQRGYLITEFPGVYRVGHRAPSLEARYLAAVKACGEGAVLSGPAAAHLYGLVKRSAPIPHVSAPRKRRVRGVVTKRSRELECTLHRGIPITTVARTLVDLASSLALSDLTLACHEAGVKYKTTPRQVEAVLARHPTARGARDLRLVTAGRAPVAQSVLERRFLALLRAHALPLPVTNKPAGTFRVDCRWPEYRLTVELDSYRFHNSRYSWEQDRRRERGACARGDDFRRYTYGDVQENPEPMLHELSACLRRAALK